MASTASASFIDASVLLDLILPDRPRYEKAARTVAASDGLAASTLSVHLAVHFARKFKITPEEVAPMLSGIKFEAVDQKVVSWAFSNMADEDFEDALQVGCAVFAGYQRFITADKRLAKNYGKFIDIQLLA